MGFAQGLSGLIGASKALDVISNNIANASTVGFKSSLTQFSDVYASALNGSVSSVQVGIGTNVAKVSQSFAQGNITPTNNPLDLAINGGGFFSVRAPDGTTGYTRNGQFELDKTGYLITAGGERLQGYPAGSPSGPAADLLMDTADIKPKTTSNVRLGMNLDSRSTIPTVPFQSTAANPLPDPLSYNSSTSVAVYDSLGNAHTYTMYFVTAGNGNWNAFASTDGQAAVQFPGDVPVANPPTGGPALHFDQSGSLVLGGSVVAATITAGASNGGTAQMGVSSSNPAGFPTGGYTLTYTADPSGTPPAPPTYTLTDGTTTWTGTGTNAASALADLNTKTTSLSLSLNLTGGSPSDNDSFTIGKATTTTPTMPLPVTANISSAYGAVAPVSFSLDFTGTSQYGGVFGVNKNQQDGYASGRLSGISIDESGQILGRYSNGQTKPGGRVVLANFADPNGLVSLGKNLWGETTASGQPIVGTPASGTLGAIQSGAVEASNTDLTRDLVDMITQQRNYQANSQTIKTEDQILQTLVNLR